VRKLSPFVDKTKLLINLAPELLKNIDVHEKPKPSALFGLAVL
jgi:hypothetical protein